MANVVAVSSSLSGMNIAISIWHKCSLLKLVFITKFLQALNIILVGMELDRSISYNCAVVQPHCLQKLRLSLLKFQAALVTLELCIVESRPSAGIFFVGWLLS